MGGEKQNKSLTVGPFECAWREELRFREAGRGCVAFEAFAQNDVTLVFREQVGSRHYHYRMDNSPNYTVILGSHRNRRLKIEAGGKTVVDVAGVGLCCSSSFQSYWISIYDGLISIGKGRHPFQNIVFQWLDSNPNCSIQYVGLSSWDKHVGYRNINVLPLTQHHATIWNNIDQKEFEGEIDGEEEWSDVVDGCKSCGLVNFLESWDLSDVLFVVGAGSRAVPAHKVILAASGEFSFSSTDHSIIDLPSTTYPVLHAFLEYIYTGQTKIIESQFSCLHDLGIQFKVSSLIKQCEVIFERSKTSTKLFDSGNKNVEITSRTSQEWRSGFFPSEIPIVVRNLKKFLTTGEHSDVNIYIEGQGLVARSHKLILSLWSAPFAKMFTNGMMESRSSDISFRDVSAETFTVMLQFMYSGELEMDRAEMAFLLIPSLVLADQFGVSVLQHECCRFLLECLSEDTVCPILQAISTVPSCKLLEETCKRNFSMHFDYCTTASTDFVLLDGATFKDILQHADMTVTSEEKVLDAILMWCMQASETCSWSVVDELLSSQTPEQIFRGRLPSIEIFLPFVRFPLMPSLLLQKLERSNISNQIPVFRQLVAEAIQYSSILRMSGSNQNLRFQHRRSSFKELQYICDGDQNGVIYYAGTSYGEHQWVNPILAKKVKVSASSPASRYTDPKAFVSRTYQGTSFASPRMENGQNCAWWMIDIGQDHQLICNYYTLRQDGSTAYARSWAFQGSMDGDNWSNLRVHDNDETICRPGQFASWPINGSTALLPFRFFRVILTGPTAGDSNLWNFCICFLELYGYFR